MIHYVHEVIEMDVSKFIRAGFTFHACNKFGHMLQCKSDGHLHGVRDLISSISSYSLLQIALIGVSMKILFERSMLFANLQMLCLVVWMMILLYDAS